MSKFVVKVVYKDGSTGFICEDTHCVSGSGSLARIGLYVTDAVVKANCPWSPDACIYASIEDFLFAWRLYLRGNVAYNDYGEGLVCVEPQRVTSFHMLDLSDGSMTELHYRRFRMPDDRKLFFSRKNFRRMMTCPLARRHSPRDKDGNWVENPYADTANVVCIDYSMQAFEDALYFFHKRHFRMNGGYYTGYKTYDYLMPLCESKLFLQTVLSVRNPEACIRQDVRVYPVEQDIELEYTVDVQHNWGDKDE